MMVLGRRPHPDDHDPAARSQRTYDGMQRGMHVAEPGGGGNCRRVHHDSRRAGCQFGAPDHREAGGGENRTQLLHNLGAPGSEVQQRAVQ